MHDSFQRVHYIVSSGFKCHFLPQHHNAFNGNANFLLGITQPFQTPSDGSIRLGTKKLADHINRVRNLSVVSNV